MSPITYTGLIELFGYILRQYFSTDMLGHILIKGIIILQMILRFIRVQQPRGVVERSGHWQEVLSTASKADSAAGK